MNVTTEETKRFLNFVDPADRNNTIKILSNMHSNMHAPIICIEMNIEGSGADYHVNCITLIIEDPVLDFKVIGLDPAFAQLKKDDAEFIISYISRRFDNLKLIFSSSSTCVFAENISDMSVAISRELNDGIFIAELFSHDGSIVLLDLSENNADFSNELWNIVLSDRNNVNCMMLAYLSGTCFVSDNIKKRIQVLYDSLTDSEKLLFELGEEI